MRWSVLILLSAVASQARGAMVAYDFVEFGSGTHLARIEIGAPPATTATGWSGTHADVLSIAILSPALFTMGPPPAVPFFLPVDLSSPADTISSFDGTRLDDGEIGATEMEYATGPSSFISLTTGFNPVVGLSQLVTTEREAEITADQTYLGDWVAAPTALVPEPSSAALLGIGCLCGLSLLARRLWRRAD